MWMDRWYPRANQMYQQQKKSQSSNVDSTVEDSYNQIYFREYYIQGIELLKIISRSFSLFPFPRTHYMCSTKSIWVKRRLKPIHISF